MTRRKTSSTSNAALAFETLREYLKQGGWKASELEGKHAFKVVKKRRSIPLTYYFQILEEEEQFLFKIVPVLTLFPDLLALAAEYTARANYGMRIGNFEVSYADAMITFKSGLNFKGQRLTRAWIDNAVQPALTAFAEYFPGLMKVLAGLETPVEAVRKIEYTFD